MKRIILALGVFALTLLGGQNVVAQDFGFGGNQQSGVKAQYSDKFTDINYADDGEAYHTLDVYLPKKAAKSYPVVIHIYGSAWFSNSSKGMADINTICAALLDAGYAVVCPNHRSSNDAKYPAQINDIKAVVRWVRGNAKKYKFDTSFIGTSGFSSGAHLASLCAISNGVKVAKLGNAQYDIEGSVGKYTKESSYVNACCEWSGPIDLMNMDCAGKRPDQVQPEDVVMGFKYQGHEDAYQLLSPIYYINRKTVPVMVFHGENDNVVPCCQGEELYEKLVKGGVKHCGFKKVKGGGHGFNMYTPENLAMMVNHFDCARTGDFNRKPKAQDKKEAAAAPSDAPQVEFAFELKVKLGQAYSVGKTSHGERFVVPITGGTFEGEGLKGTIIEGGADYQLQDKEHGRTELEAIYCIRTDDGVNIHVRNNGLICNGKDANGNPTFYFRAAPKFEAPADSKYAWLNNSLFLCTPQFAQDGIGLKIWRVK
jgi:acetyl esterase/lipase